jgi:hypothetical protein
MVLILFLDDASADSSNALLYASPHGFSLQKPGLHGPKESGCTYRDQFSFILARNGTTALAAGRVGK